MENKQSTESKGKKTPTKVVAPQTPAAPAKQNAAQKIEALENAFITQNNQIDILAEEIDNLRLTILSLSKRLNASIKAAEEGGLSDESVNKIMMNENIKELESRVLFLVEQGLLERDDETPITEKNFVVGREIDIDGNVVNPRVQFSVGSLGSDLKSALIGKQTGSVVAYDQNEPSVEILEIYNIVDPKIKKSFEKQESAE